MDAGPSRRRDETACMTPASSSFSFVSIAYHFRFMMCAVHLFFRP